MRKLFCLLMLLAGLVVGLSAQDYNYVNYTIRDGLASNTVYSMCQDKDGYLWFATSNGLSRFNGKQFTNFSVKDGLPDNEVLKIFCDSRGRVWIATFKNEIAYYWKGKIFNRTNDSLIRKLEFNSNIHDFYELPIGSLWLIGTNEVYRVRNHKIINKVFDAQKNPHKVNQRISTAPFWFGNDFTMWIGDSVFRIGMDNKWTFYKIISSGNLNRILIPRKWIGDTIAIDLPYELVKSTATSAYSNPYLAATIKGLFLLDTLEGKVSKPLLEGYFTTAGLLDAEEVLWITTYSDGVFKIPNINAKTLKLHPGKATGVNEVFSISTLQDGIFAGYYNGTMIQWKNGEKKVYNHFNDFLRLTVNNISTNRLTVIQPLEDNTFLLGFDGYLAKWKAPKTEVIPIVAIKSITPLEKDKFLVSTARFVVTVDARQFKILDTVWIGRSTSSVGFKGKKYIGTINGLYRIDATGNKEFMGNTDPVLSRRITAIVKSDKSIWVGTSDSGLVEYNGTQVVRGFSERNGLISNNVRVLHAADKGIWVGTNNGMCKIEPVGSGRITHKYNDLNLLPSNIVNAINTDSDYVYVGTPLGLTYFKERDLESKSICRLSVTHINGRRFFSADSSVLSLPFRNNVFEVTFDGVSMKSAGEIRYFYRMGGVESRWQQTTNNEVTFSGLPPGDYLFELFAENKFGNRSKVFKKEIVVQTPFWRSLWFYLLVALLIVFVTVALTRYRARLQLQRITRESEIQKTIVALEQKALSAQMNPHFIFNSLNGIQQFIMQNDVAAANHYLTLFAQLIRETMENSIKKRITVREEINFLTKYLELERMRFSNRFTYAITADIEDDLVEIPVMLIQPFVENALRHGIRNRNDDAGLVKVQFTQKEDTLTCIIEDNGVGIAKTMASKGIGHNEYQSRGMELTKSRIELINQSQEENASMDIVHLYDANGNPTGTKVVIIIKSNFYA